jgi:tetratricopeptide (TPR) repeat protein
VLRCAALLQQVTRYVRMRADGNPLYIRELCTFLEQQRLCVIASGVAYFVSQRPPEGDSTPMTLQGLIVTRVDRLDVQTRECLRLASVFGEDFALEELERALTGQVRTRLRTILKRLEAEALLARKAQTSEVRYRFSHDLIRAAIYESIAPSTRARLHARVADLIHELEPPDTIRHAGRLAYHYERSNQHAEATTWAVAAAELAYASFAHAQVIAFYESALRVATAPDTAQRAVWQLRVGCAYVALRDYESATEPLREALSGLGFPMPRTGPRGVASALRELAVCTTRELSKRRTQRVPTAPQRAALCGAADALEALGEVYYFTEQPVLCFLSVLRELRLAQLAGPSPQLARAYANAAITAGLMPLHDLARSLFRKAAAVDEPDASGHVLLVRGMYHAGRGHWQAALADLGGALAHSTGRRRLELDVVSNVAYVAYFTGRYAEAAKLAKHLLRVAAFDPRYADEGRRILLYCSCARFDPAAARGELKALEAMLKLKDTSAHVSSKADFHAHRALLAARGGTAGPALRDAEEALRLREQNTTGIGYYTDIVAMDAVARALIALRERADPTPELEQLWRRADAVLRKMAKVYDCARQLSENAQLGWQRASAKRSTKRARIVGSQLLDDAADLLRVDIPKRVSQGLVGADAGNLERTLDVILLELFGDPGIEQPSAYQ